jgi:hypothetical protein
MDDRQPCVTLAIPDAEDFEEGYSTIAVPYLVVTGTIDVLQAMIAQWHREDGCEPDDELWGHLMGAAGLALGGLIAAYARERSAQGRASNERMREHVARNLAANKQDGERVRQPAAPQQEQAPVADSSPPGSWAAAEHDPGWEF